MRGEMFVVVQIVTCVTRLIIRKLRLQALHPLVQIPEKRYIIKMLLLITYRYCLTNSFW